MVHLSLNIVRLLIGAMYAISGCLKMLDVRLFINDLSNFDIIPLLLVVPVAIVIIAGEILLGLALLVGYRTRFASMILAGLTAIFVFVVFVCYVRGVAPECGCFGPVLRERVEAGVLVRDLILMTGCLWLSLQQEANFLEKRLVAHEQGNDK